MLTNDVHHILDSRATRTPNNEQLESVGLYRSQSASTRYSYKNDENSESVAGQSPELQACHVHSPRESVIRHPQDEHAVQADGAEAADASSLGIRTGQRRMCTAAATDLG